MDVTLVLPFFNPGPTVLLDTLERSATTLSAAGITFEIIAVSDGSTDGSHRALDGLLPGVLQTIVLPTNRGKGYALREGMSRGSGRYIGFIDADGDIAPEVLSEFVTATADNPDIIYGTKLHRGGRIHYPFVRKVYSWAYRHLVKNLFDLPLVDTQTGVKLVRREVLSVLLPFMIEDGFAFDLELFVLARQLGFDRLVELPVRVQKRASSTISIRSVWSIWRDTVAIFWRHRIRRSSSAVTSVDAGRHEGSNAHQWRPDEDADADCARQEPGIEVVFDEPGGLEGDR